MGRLAVVMVALKWSYLIDGRNLAPGLPSNEWWSSIVKHPKSICGSVRCETYFPPVNP